MLDLRVKRIGQRIKDIRLSKKMNQAEFAHLIDATVPAVSNWENGRNMPNSQRLKLIAEVANVSINDILGENVIIDDETLHAESSIDPNNLRIEITKIYNIVKHPEVGIDASRLYPHIIKVINEYNELFPDNNINTSK